MTILTVRHHWRVSAYDSECINSRHAVHQKRHKNMSAAAGGEVDKKPGVQVTHINLKVKGKDGNEVHFRIKKSAQLEKLMTAYCDRQSAELNSIAFLFDGRRIRAEQTPDELGLEDGDEIDAMEHQFGGRSSRPSAAE